VPEYVAPAVFIGEEPAGAVPIEGVSTATTAFIGQAVGGSARQLASAVEAAAACPLDSHNLLGHALQLFFANGGQSAWIAPIATIDAEAVAAALASLPAVEVALTAVPEASTLAGAGYAAVLRVMLDDARRLRRFAVIDAPLAADVAEVLRLRAGLDSSFGALYWPALSCGQRNGGRTPPSGAVCGAYALSDQERGVFRSGGGLPLREVGAPVGQASSSELAELDAAGINVIRVLPGIGVRIWGAHTLSFDRQLRSLTLRRHLLFLQNSISRGTRWTVHERNDARLWQELRTQIAEFLRWQFLDGALRGSQAAEAYYVHCDESTVSADDRAAGVVVCEVGVALLRAAEFITFRVAQRTARG